MKKSVPFLLFLLLYCCISLPVQAQKKLEAQIADSLSTIANSYTWVGKLNLSDLSFNTASSKVTVIVNERFSYMPFRPANVARIYNAIRSILPEKYKDYTIVCLVDGKRIEDLVPVFYSGQVDSTRLLTTPLTPYPLVSNISRPYSVNNGLQNRHLAMWQSHGWYYDQKSARWKWQRARIFEIVEDLYTQSYMLPFLVPMLENAGANVLLPRERDTQLNEVVVDNDAKSKDSRYRERNDQKSWKKGDDVGFAHPKKFYLQGENPFTMGTYRVAQAVPVADETSKAEWTPLIPEAGKYAVYVSYKSLPNSAPDAHYTVFHKGGKTEFVVNQQMNGGTWLYLGSFYFDKGRNTQYRVMLTNFSNTEGAVVTADAVKFGGGMGNIARCPNEAGILNNQKSSDTTKVAPLTVPVAAYDPEVSTYPRYTEGARYWLQWAGVPDSIYSKSQGKNDYTDDYQSRGNWVNYLTGGSVYAPSTPGLKVPVDMSFAFHTDAGTTFNDSIIGTLAICTVNSNGKTVFPSALSRWTSRDLTDIVQTQIVNDIKKQYATEWVRRGIWNKTYSESRAPEVPSMLLELLSHQNFADMRYGLDPRFRFTVSRSIYKGILRFMSALHHTDYTVQPLPVDQVSCRFVEKNKVELKWHPVLDSLETTATPDNFVIYTRVDDGAFDNGVLVGGNQAIITIQPGKIYSFKVTAVNKGGESFPSEILSACRSLTDKETVMVVNGFDRLSAPVSVAVDMTYAGFLNDMDAGVPYVSDYTFIGNQNDFDRRRPWVDDDAPGFGGSNADYETTVVAGNTFDYPAIHGQSIRAAGYSFVSSSSKAVMDGVVDLNQYKMVDLIMGKQKQTYIGNYKKAPEFKTFPLALQQILKNYCNQGGNVMVSGAFIGSDMCDGFIKKAEDKQFIENVLKYKYRTRKAAINGEVKIVDSSIRNFKKCAFNFYDKPNSAFYYVEAPDAIEPVDDKGQTICRYNENNISAGVAYNGSYKTCAFGFPFETIKSEAERNRLMEQVLDFFFSLK